MFERLKRLPIIRSAYRLPWLMGPYHYLLALLAAWWYRFPSRRLTVIGVTGTKGKTTTSNLVYQILSASGRKTGLATSVMFAIGEKQWVNETKQTMLGRFGLQRLIREMVEAGCRYAVIETSSEGILQYRHRFIDYDTVVFTNISPEHIERHGSFENYRAEKVKLFSLVGRKKKGTGIYNLDDKNVDHFLKPPIKTKIGIVHEHKERVGQLASKYALDQVLAISRVELAPNKTKFRLGDQDYEMPLVGEFNVHNAASAIAVAMAEDVPIAKIQNGLRRARPVPGRFEIINEGQPFTVIVDYAHEPASLEAVYKAAKLFKPKHIIGLLGAQGGGRDKWKRAAMGKIAAHHCDQIVLSNEDPYDEDPQGIIDDIKKGIYETSKDFKPVYKIPDRMAGILKALTLAQKGDVVVLTGKGGEVWMCVENGRKVRWDERAIVEDLIRKNSDYFVAKSGRNMRYEANS